MSRVQQVTIDHSKLKLNYFCTKSFPGSVGVGSNVYLLVPIRLLDYKVYNIIKSWFVCVFFSTQVKLVHLSGIWKHTTCTQNIFSPSTNNIKASGRLGVKSNYRSKSDWVWRLVMQLCREISTKDFSLLSNCYSMSLSSSRDLKPAIIIMSPSAVRWCEQDWHLQIHFAKMMLFMRRREE